MARITKKIDLGNGLTQTEENRTARVVITPNIDGTVSVTFERMTVTRINGQPIGGPAPCRSVTLSDAESRAVPEFAIVYGALSKAGDAGEEAMEKAIASSIVNDAADAAAKANNG